MFQKKMVVGGKQKGTEKNVRAIPLYSFLRKLVYFYSKVMEEIKNVN